MQSWVDISAPINWDDPLNKGLRHWWYQLPEQSGAFVWRDLTRRAPMTLVGGAALQRSGRAPDESGCASFDGTNDYGVTATTDLSGVSQLTVSLWYYANTFDTSNDLLLESSPTANSNIGAFQVNPNASALTCAARIHTAAAGDSTVTFTKPTSAAWHYWTFVLNRNAGAQQVVAVYIDNVSQALTQTFTDATSTGGFGNYAWNFMSRNGASLFAPGRLANIKIHTRMLGRTEVGELYAAARNPRPPQLRWLGRSRFAAEQTGGAPTTSPHYYRRRQRAA